MTLRSFGRGHSNILSVQLRAQQRVIHTIRTDLQESPHLGECVIDAMQMFESVKQRY